VWRPRRASAAAWQKRTVDICPRKTVGKRGPVTSKRGPQGRAKSRHPAHGCWALDVYPQQRFLAFGVAYLGALGSLTLALVRLALLSPELTGLTRLRCLTAHG